MKKYFTPETLTRFKSKLARLKEKMISIHDTGVNIEYSDSLLEKFLDTFEEERNVSVEIMKYNNGELLLHTDLGLINFFFYEKLYQLEKWKNFDYDNAKEILIRFANKKTTDDNDASAIEKIVEKFPKGLNQSKEEMDKLKRYASKMPDAGKKLKLKEDVEERSKIFEYNKKLDHYKELVIDAYNNGYDNGYSAELLENFMKAFIKFVVLANDIKKITINNVRIAIAVDISSRMMEVHDNLYNLSVWKNFDYKEAIKILLKYADSSELDGLVSRENIKEYVKHLPKGIEQSKEAMDKIKKTAKKMPEKKLKLKEK